MDKQSNCNKKRWPWIEYVFYPLLLAILLLLNIPVPIEREFDAIEIKLDDPSYFVRRTIHIDGYYLIHIFERNEFDGQITIPGYELISKPMKRPLGLGEYGATLEYVGSTPQAQTIEKC